MSLERHKKKRTIKGYDFVVWKHAPRPFPYAVRKQREHYDMTEGEGHTHNLLDWKLGGTVGCDMFSSLHELLKLRRQPVMKLLKEQTFTKVI